MTYRYTERNLLADPHHYMYAPFEGADFLRAYREDRRRRLAALDPVPQPASVREHVRTVLPGRPREAEFETLALLLDLAVEPDAEWLAALVGRFEVTKRLFRRYGAGLRPLDDRFDLLDNYALLALLCADACARGASLKYLNATIKLGDVLCSVDLAGESELTRWAAREAVARELRLVEGLLERHEIDL